MSVAPLNNTRGWGVALLCVFVALGVTAHFAASDRTTDTGGDAIRHLSRALETSGTVRATHFAQAHAAARTQVRRATLVHETFDLFVLETIERLRDLPRETSIEHNAPLETRLLTCLAHEVLERCGERIEDALDRTDGFPRQRKRLVLYQQLTNKLLEVR